MTASVGIPAVRGGRAGGPRVHPSAVVAPGARLADGVVVGPFAVVGELVSLGPGTTVGAHAVIEGRTVLGANNRVGTHAVLGALPQIRAVDQGGELQIGDGNQLREFCTIHLGAPGSCTIVGDDNLVMAYAHVAHDCRLASGIELANGVQLAGGVEVGDAAVLGGLCAVHQLVRVGRLAMIGAGAMVSQDVPPFSLASGDRARLYGSNTVGLRRRGIDDGARRAIARALRLLARAPSVEQAIRTIGSDAALCGTREVVELLDFVQQSRRGLCRPVSR